MKITRIVSLVVLLLLSFSGRAATPAFKSFDTNDFVILPNISAPSLIQTRTHSTNTGDTIYVTNLFVTNIVSSNIFTTNLYVTNAYVTNLTVNNITIGTNTASDLYWTTNSANHLVETDDSRPVAINKLRVYGSDTRISKAVSLALGTNTLESGTYSQIILLSPTNDAAQVILSLKAGADTVQHLELMNYTNGTPYGNFTLPEGSDVADLPGGKVRLLGGKDWVSTNGTISMLRFLSPDWVEVGRFDLANPPATTGDLLWTNNAGVLEPIDISAFPFHIDATQVNFNDTTYLYQDGTTDFGQWLSVTQGIGEGGVNFGTGGTNELYRSGSILAYTNATPDLRVQSPDLATYEYLKLVNGTAPHFGASGTIFVDNDLSTHSIAPDIDDTRSIGNNSSAGAYHDYYQKGTAHIQGMNDGLGNYSRMDLYHTGTNGGGFIASKAAGIAGGSRPIVIGSDAISPNFSPIHAALEISNFRSQGKALTIDAKVGQTGNEDWPVYFYAQDYAGTAHPTWNFEETGNMGSNAHQSMWVSYVAGVTNSVTAWPTYILSSQTAGYFNSAPYGQPGAAMGLMGSVDGANATLNVGIGAYVEPGSSSAMTNVAFSASVASYAAAQSATAGYFELGQPGTMPKIDTAVVLLDSQATGAPLLIARTNNTSQMFTIQNDGSFTSGKYTNRWVLAQIVPGTPTNLVFIVDGQKFQVNATPVP